MQNQSSASAAEDQPSEASIIIVNHNAGDKLLNCLSCVLGRTDENKEILVVDNASTDGAADLIEMDFPQVTVIRSDANLGFGAGCNLAARRAKGVYLVFLNPDTTVEHGWLESLIKPLRTDARAGLVTAKILLAEDADRINTCGNTVHITGIAMCRGLGLPRSELGEPADVAAVSGAAFAIRRTLFESLDGFDEDMFLYVEDTDLSWRARLAGWRCLYTPESVVHHQYNFKLTPWKVFYQERNRYLMLLKTLRWPTILVLLPSLVLAELITWGFVLQRDRRHLSNKINAYRWLLTRWSDILKKRRATQQLRKTRDRSILRNTEFRLEFNQVSSGLIAFAARLVFTPVFFLLKLASMAIVWW